MRRRTATSAVQVVTPAVWAVDDTGFAKDGSASACVARQYSGTLGKVGKCQIAVSVHAASDTASAMLDWRLFVPESWDETCVPDEAGKVANIHARRLRRQPATLDEAGKKKPHVRKQVGNPPGHSSRRAGRGAATGDYALLGSPAPLNRTAHRR